VALRNVLSEEVEDGGLVISLGLLLGKGHGDGGGLVSEQVLHVSLGDVLTQEVEHGGLVVTFCFLLSKGNGDGGRLVSDEVLKVAPGDVVIHQTENAVLITLSGSSGKEQRGHSGLYDSIGLHAL
jgi:hypothetical protein